MKPGTALWTPFFRLAIDNYVPGRCGEVTEIKGDHCISRTKDGRVHRTPLYIAFDSREACQAYIDAHPFKRPTR